MSAVVLLTVPEVRTDLRTFLSESFTHQPEAYTEIYFDIPHTLPTTYKADEPIPVSFLIHNRTTRETTYDYIVYVASDVRQPSVVRKHVTLAAGTTVGVRTELPAADYGKRIPVTVELSARSQHIQYWLERDDG